MKSLKIYLTLRRGVSGMGTIVNIGSGKKIFNLEQANEILPVILKLTKDSMTEVKNLMAQIEGNFFQNETHKIAIEKTISEHLSHWQMKIAKLGAKPKGLWIVDFDSGQGYYCWKYPEKTVSHWHGYEDGFSARRSLGQNFDLEPKL